MKKLLLYIVDRLLGTTYFNPKATLLDAVMDQNKRQVKRLIKKGADLEVTSLKDKTPLILAAVTDQFRIANILLDAGANPFAVSMFGWTAGYAAQTSRLARGPEYKALQIFKDKLRHKNYPVPGPEKDEIEAMVAEGNWPPKNWDIQ